MTQYSIVVEVPEPKDTIFVARPFSDDFDGIRDAILRAIAGVTRVNSSGTEIIFAGSGEDLNPEITTNFIQDMAKKTREARCVVAVCSQEEKTKKPNPNIMYELGFARSIGKPTVILMRKEEKLPANLQGNQVLFYEQGKEQAIVSELTKVLTSVLGFSSKTKLIDEVSYSPNIWVASAHDWLTLKPNLWRDFLTILKFGKEVHELFFDLYSSHLKPLHAGVEAIYTGVVAPDRVVTKKADCTRMWDEYIKRCDTEENYLKDDFIKFIAKTENDVDGINEYDTSENTEYIDTIKRIYQYIYSSMQVLNTTIKDASTKNVLSKIDSYLRVIRKQLNTFSEKHKAIIDNIHPKKGFNSTLDQAAIMDTWALLGALSAASHGLTSNADSLIKGLIELLLLTERSHT